MQKNWNRIFLVVAVTISLGAQSALATPPAKPAAKGAAERLAETMLPMDQYNQMMAAIMQMADGMLQAKVQQTGKTIDTAALKKKLEAKVRAKFSRDGYFTRMNADTMKKMFTAAELEKILAFYNTPEGMKWIKNTPEIVKTTMTKTQADLQSELPKMVDSLGIK